MTYFRVSQSGTLPQGDIWISNFHVLSSGTTAAVHAAASAGIASFWNNTYKALCNTGVTLGQVVTTELDPATGKNKNAQVSSNNIAGTVATVTAPQNTCVLISYRTANAGKAGRGRQYLPPVAAANLKTDGSLVNATRDSIDTAWQSFMTGLNTTGTPVILHGGFTGRVDGVPQYVQLTSDAITTMAVATTLATQRRRVNKLTRTYSPFLAIA